MSSDRTFFLTPALSLWKREVVRFLRQRNRIVSALATPLVFWLLIGSGLNSSFRMGEGPVRMSYLEYFFPGTIILIMLFTAIFATISIIEDRREGFLQSVLVAPVSPGSIVLGKLLGGTTLALLQAVLFTLLAPTIGIGLSWLIMAKLLAAFFVVGLGLTGLGFLFAWPMESTQGFHALMNLLLMPLWLMSGALFPSPPPNSWVYWVVLLNPVTYGVAAVRRALYANDPGVAALPSFGVALAVSAGFALLTYLLSYRLVQRRRKVTG